MSTLRRMHLVMKFVSAAIAGAATATAFTFNAEDQVQFETIPSDAYAIETGLDIETSAPGYEADKLAAFLESNERVCGAYKKPKDCWKAIFTAANQNPPCDFSKLGKQRPISAGNPGQFVLYGKHVESTDTITYDAAGIVMKNGRVLLLGESSSSAIEGMRVINFTDGFGVMSDEKRHDVFKNRKQQLYKNGWRKQAGDKAADTVNLKLTESVLTNETQLVKHVFPSFKLKTCKEVLAGRVAIANPLNALPGDLVVLENELQGADKPADQPACTVGVIEGSDATGEATAWLSVDGKVKHSPHRKAFGYRVKGLVSLGKNAGRSHMVEFDDSFFG